ncbi:hypothetical protein Prede_1347 [Prevotella dentalis DSM 3688]|uniref:Uncharacterized protein n=1 Tax=Prevotella dentalis (strain ATCC 49559 / DSM 3688 / JCM 13448 / NCTC 12043 / ES 2772) TaxID=908937 RepID=F9D2Z5_PREDD|nr:hypothetical protein [Prevotella dentalis]AGB28667.1 hypothetical protein Prede_1347 [Prevotella dentalis DSM 3688]EGQ15462.1 hypothetical protein HMPREF9136_1223 [Prevotella dentalis DSM 3688]
MENKNVIRINGVDYVLKYTIRALFVFEQLTDKPFQVKTVTDNYIFLYSMILACNPDCTLTWQDFLKALDENPDILNNLSQITADVATKQQMFDKVGEKDNGKKKD